MCGQIRQNGQNVVNLTSNLHLVMRTIRGSSAYWNNSYLDLLAIVNVLGPGHLFITLSCNDLNWEFMLKACLDAQGNDNIDPSQLSLHDRQLLVENNPVTVSRVFNKEVQNFIRLLKSGDAFNGYKAKDYWYRIEWQQRGSPHLHLILWIENFPKLDTVEGIKAMDSLVRCDIPEDDDELAYLVKKYQIHKHSHTCYKNNKNNTCRFGFPRPACKKTRVLEIDTTEFLKNGHRIVEMERPANCKFVNNYNPNILKHWQANMDIQFITSQSIIAYIAKYSCKSEPDSLSSIVGNAIKEAQQSNEQMGKRLFKVGMKILSQREVSCCEAATRLCHLPMRGSTRKIVFINTSKPEDRYRMFKIDDKSGDNSYYTNIIDRYIRRPDVPSIDELSLAEFACLYQPHYHRKNSALVVDEEDGDIEFANNEENEEIDDLDPDKPKKSSLKIYELKKIHPNETRAYIKERKKPAIFRSRYFSPNGNRIQYFYSLLLLHLPFRDEASILDGYNADDTEKAFMDKKDYLRPLRNDCTFEEYQGNADEINRAVLQIRALMDNDGDLIEEGEPQRNPDGFLATQEEEIVDMIDDYHEPLVPVRYDPTKLNLGQKKVYRYVQKVVKAELEERNPTQIKLFITGSAGTGKSVLINNIVQLMKDSFIDSNYRNRSVVQIAAPTGVAAKQVYLDLDLVILLLTFLHCLNKQVNGRTLHSALSLGIELGKVSKHKPLTGNYLESQRKIWEFTRFIVVDEISMVSYELFKNISLRLQELKQKELPFGGLHIFVFGDLMQLRPVKGHPIYIQPEYHEAEPHLWKYFDFFELTQNMRQKDDLDWAVILDSLRFGELDLTQIEMIKTRVESELLKREGIFSDEKATLIAPTIAIADDHNTTVLVKLIKPSKENPNPPKIYKINAIDRLIENHKGVTTPDMSKIVPKEDKHCAGVPKTIDLIIGARVMLRRNISQSKSLVNGSLGRVVGFTWRSFRKDQIEDGEHPESVQVEFDNIGVHDIQPVSCTFNAKFGYGKVERLQIPLILAWAVTAHKLQSLTVESAVLSLGKEIFAPGQAYVMLSRVRNLNKLLILRTLDEKKLTNCADPQAIKEMKRLRNLPEIDWETLDEKLESDLGKRLK